MKIFLPALMAALLLIPCVSHAQGYGGVMAPQGGYQPGQQQASDALAGAMPYTGTGGSENTGYISMTSPNGDAPPPVQNQTYDNAASLRQPVQADPAGQGAASADTSPVIETGVSPPGNSTGSSFYEDDGQARNVYQMVQDTSTSPEAQRQREERRREAERHRDDEQRKRETEQRQNEAAWRAATDGSQQQ